MSKIKFENQMQIQIQDEAMEEFMVKQEITIDDSSSAALKSNAVQDLAMTIHLKEEFSMNGNSNSTTGDATIGDFSTKEEFIWDHTGASAATEINTDFPLDEKIIPDDATVAAEIKPFATPAHTIIDPDKPYKCGICFKAYTTSSSLSYHKKTAHALHQKHQCSICLKFLSTKRSLTMHSVAVHGQDIKDSKVKLYQCQLCPKSYLYFDGSRLERHVLQTHVVDKPFECHICCKTYINEATLQRHLSLFHETLRFPCDVCSRRFKYKDGLVRHLGVEHHRFLLCDRCSKSFVNKSEFDQHLELVGPNSALDFHCQICLESLKNQCCLTIHMECHLKDLAVRQEPEPEPADADLKPTPTTICENQMIPVQVEMGEITLETTRQEFKCELCSRIFELNSHFLSHILIAHKNATWPCPTCPRSFNKRWQLKKHQVLHEAQTFPCSLCPKSFHRIWNLQAHQKTHSGDSEKEFKCEICSKHFHNSLGLRRHTRIEHNKAKTFKCPICPASFTQQGQLNSHLVTHESAKTLQCNLCDKSFKYSNSVTRHLFKAHGVRKSEIDGRKLKRPPRPTKYTETIVFVCTAKGCSRIGTSTGTGSASVSFDFESRDEKEAALHYAKHGLPKVKVGLYLKNPKLEIRSSGDLEKLIQKRFKCRDCPRTYLKTASLREHHLLAHAKTTRLQCSICCRRFAKPFLLEKHNCTTTKNTRVNRRNVKSRN